MQLFENYICISRVMKDNKCYEEIKTFKGVDKPAYTLYLTISLTKLYYTFNVNPFRWLLTINSIEFDSFENYEDSLKNNKSVQSNSRTNHVLQRIPHAQISLVCTILFNMLKCYNVPRVCFGARGKSDNGLLHRVGSGDRHARTSVLVKPAIVSDTLMYITIFPKHLFLLNVEICIRDFWMIMNGYCWNGGYSLGFPDTEAAPGAVAFHVCVIVDFFLL